MRLARLLADITVNSGQLKIPKADLTPDKTQSVINIIFGIFGAVAVLIITIGAFRLIISRGNPEALNKARNTVIYACIGLLVTLVAYAIVMFIAGIL